MKKVFLTAVSAAILLGVCLFHFCACKKVEHAYDVYLKVNCYYMRDDDVEPMRDPYHLEKTIILEKEEVTTDSLVLRTRGYYYFWVHAYYHGEPENNDRMYSKVDVDNIEDEIPADVRNDKEEPYFFILDVPIHSYRGTIPARYALRLNIVPFEEIEEGGYRDQLLEEMK